MLMMVIIYLVLLVLPLGVSEVMSRMSAGNRLGQGGVICECWGAWDGCL